MIVDTSAVIAVLNAEDGWQEYDRALRSATDVQMSAATYVELGIVVDRREDPAISRLLDRLMTQWSVKITELTPTQAAIARSAHRDFGRGTGLDLGDCFAYALAADTGQPLLFKGDGFSHTDITPALARPSAAPPPSPGTG